MIAFTVEVEMPDSEGNCQCRVTYGPDPEMVITRVEPWMLEAAAVAVHASKAALKKLEAGALRQFVKTGQLMRAQIEKSGLADTLPVPSEPKAREDN